MDMKTPHHHDAVAALRATLPATELGVLEIMEKVKAKYVSADWDDDLSRVLGMLIRTTVTRRMNRAPDAEVERRETRALIVVGEAGTGKTESLGRKFRNHPGFPGYGRIGSGCPLISVSVPSPCTLKTLGMQILRSLGYPLVRDIKEHLVWNEVYKRLEATSVLLLHLDEMHNLTDAANVDQLDAVRKTLKSLMASPTWPVGLIVSGLPGIVPDLQEVDEIRRRGRFVRVPLLDLSGDHETIKEIVFGLAEVAGLTIAEGEISTLAPRLGHAALARLGILIELIHEAIEIALLARDREPDGDACPVEVHEAVEVSANAPSYLTTEHFATAYSDRTGVGGPMNPFVSRAWAEIDCSLVLVDEPPPEPVLPEDPAPRKTGGKAASKKSKKKGTR